MKHAFDDAAPLLEVDNLIVTFADGKRVVTATRGVSFTIKAGERVALVGESGSGKSVTARSVLRIEYPGEIDSKSLIRLDGFDMTATNNEKELRPFRGGVAAMIFQDPETAFVPIKRIGAQIVETLLVHHDGMSKKDAMERAIKLLRDVRLDEPEEAANKFPLELSGGQQQRALIAMMLSGEPKLLIADEATTALDVRIQAQVLDLISEIVDERDMALLFITHDLSVVARLCDRVLVMYAGRIVEEGTKDEIFSHPSHPYTRALLTAVPRMDIPNRKSFTAIPGDPPKAHEEIVGCPFRLRECKYAQDICAKELPALSEMGGSQFSACHFSETVLSSPEVTRGS